MAMKETTKSVIKYLQENPTTDFVAADVAEALGLTTKQVDGIFTSAIQKKNYGYREEAEIKLEDGKHKAVKFLRLNDAGRAFDVDAVEDAPVKTND